MINDVQGCVPNRVMLQRKVLPGVVFGQTRNRIAIVAFVAAYLALSFLAAPSVWSEGPTTHLYNAGNPDVNQGVWYIGQTAFSLLHLANPFDNNWLNYPWGVNLVDNTGQQLLSLTVMPITLLFGPVFSYNLLMLSCFPTAAVSMFFVLRRWTRRLPIAFVGGLIYGFSPYMVAEGHAHLNLLFVPFPPIAMWAIDKVLVRHRGSALSNGMLIGGLCVALLFIEVEILTTLIIIMCLAVVFILVSPYAHRIRERVFRLWATSLRYLRARQSSRRPAYHRSSHLARRRGPTSFLVENHNSQHAASGRLQPDWPYLFKTFLVSFVILLLASAYPFWVAVRGRGHITGPAQPIGVVAGLSSDLLTPLIPTVNQHFTFGMALVGTRLVAEQAGSTVLPNGSENGGYIGVPLLLVLVAGSIVLWKSRRIVRLCVIMGISSYILSMGSLLKIDGHFTSIRLPFILLTHLPFVDSEVPSRYTLYVWVFVSILLVVILDGIYTRLSGNATVGRLVAVIVIAFTLTPLVPAWPYSTGPTGTPEFYLSSEVKRVPLGSTLLPYPYPAVGQSQAMLWQAVARMRFRMPGGAVIIPGRHDQATFLPRLTPVANTLLECYGGIGPVPVSSAAVQAGRVALVELRIDTMVVPMGEAGSACAAEYLQQLAGAPSVEYGSLVWNSVLCHLDFRFRQSERAT